MIGGRVRIEVALVATLVLVGTARAESGKVFEVGVGPGIEHRGDPCMETGCRELDAPRTQVGVASSIAIGGWIDSSRALSFRLTTMFTAADRPPFGHARRELHLLGIGVQQLLPYRFRVGAAFGVIVHASHGVDSERGDRFLEIDTLAGFELRAGYELFRSQCHSVHVSLASSIVPPQDKRQMFTTAALFVSYQR